MSVGGEAAREAHVTGPESIVPSHLETPPPEDKTLWRRLKELPRQIGRAALAGFSHGITNYAAALTFYSLLSLFPALIIVVGLLAVFGKTSASQLIVTLIDQLAPAGAAETIRGPITQIVSQRAGAETLLSLSVIVALVAASAYIGTFIWAVERVYAVAKPPSFLKQLPRQLLFAVIILVLLAVLGVVAVSGGPVAKTLGGMLGLGSTAVRLYQVARWPLLLVAAVLLFFTLYVAAPDVQRRGFIHALPGAVLGVAVWLVASALFGLYVSHLGRYGATYGTLAGLVVFLMWIWILNLALLLGAEFNVQLGRLPARSP